jgi:hypothetical protein
MHQYKSSVFVIFSSDSNTLLISETNIAKKNVGSVWTEIIYKTDVSQRGAVSISEKHCDFLLAGPMLKDTVIHFGRVHRRRRGKSGVRLKSSNLTNLKNLRFWIGNRGTSKVYDLYFM